MTGLLIAIASVATTAQLPAEWQRADDRFRQGVAALERGEPSARMFAEAAESWSEPAEGWRTPARNIGNARYLSGDLPGAIAAYLVALQDDPLDRNVARNLRLARREIEGRSSGWKIDDMKLFLIEHRPPDWVTIALWLTAAVTLPWSDWSRRPTVRWLWLAPTILFAVMQVPIGLAWEDRSNADGVVRLETTLRTGNSELFAEIGQPLPPGAEVVMLSERGGWRQVVDRDGVVGWMPADAVIDIGAQFSSRPPNRGGQSGGRPE